MVKKATELKTLDELNISARTRTYLRKKGTSLDKLVLIGREAAINYEAHPEIIEDEPKWKQELASALDKAGYIRHDLYPRTYNVWRLYRALCKVANPPISNEFYETFEAFTDEKFAILMNVLYTLNDRESKVIIDRFGIENGKSLSLEAVGRKLSCTRERVRQIESKAIRKIIHTDRHRMLPSLWS